MTVMDQSIAVHHFVYSRVLADSNQLSEEDFSVLSDLYMRLSGYIGDRFSQKSLVLM